MQTTPHASLYRKYRPQKWNEVAGQSHIVQILEEEVKKPQPSHAFLFVGSRGIGKTTIARIFAENIGTAPEDLYEIDAASNTSVEDIRILNEAVYTLPLNSKFKVYILDEVHMLSKSAFNAFLKTLEEPPKHVIFILATTELHKIPETIISRCQTFHFNKPNIKILSALVQDVAKKEGVKIDPEAAELVAMVGNGSFRDTLSALQTVIGLGNDKGKEGGNSGAITRQQIEETLGLPAHMLVENFLAAVFENDSNAASDADKNIGLAAGLKVLQEVYTSNLDTKIFVDQTMNEIRNRLLGKKDVGSSTPMIQMLELLLESREQLGKTHISVLPIELALFKFFFKK